MGADRTLAPETKNETWTACTGTPDRPERHFVGAKNRRTLAGYAGTLWQVDNHLQPLPALAEGRGLEQDVC